MKIFYKTIKNTALIILSAIVLSVLMFTLSSCKALQKDEWEDNGKINIMTTVFPPYDFVRQIAGDKVNLKVLTPTGGEVHSVEITSNMQKLISESDLFIMIGGEGEKWLEGVLKSAKVEKSRVLTLIEGIDLIEVGVEHEEDHDDDHNHTFDEHIWTSPKNAIKMVERISHKLCEIDPENSDFYKENTEKYIDKLNKLDSKIRETTENAEFDTIIVADRLPFIYFTTEYGLNYHSAFDGCTANADPNPTTIRTLIDKVKEQNIKYIFYVEFSSKTIANTVANETGAELRLLHSCHNISKEDYKNGVTYIDLMEQNLEVLREVLNDGAN